ncbi:PP2C family protein-serine/threonine phosphatase [Jannaschia sp. W003]|uniref:PP2C family protein-serine/threonine phosphatase n=1 Tax=Jannaschia sp. W003 TaxID=2867012 RepID=UPI0021A6BB14|nr:fused response regulator/phosphatase [Jannaschia sp. W003]UWQ22143.1 fused response regulator/phosphatase [Jannaschia sp. W003]
MDGSQPCPAPPRPGAPPGADRPVVLVVDDSAAQRRLVCAVLARMDLQVLAADCPHEALALVAGRGAAPVDMVISGWQLPGMDGPAFCRAFRALGAERYTYFLLTTAQSDGRAKALGLDAGADDFVTRPVGMAELRARVRAGLRMIAMQEDLRQRNAEVAAALGELQAIQDAVNRDLVEARRIQRAFLPPDGSRIGGHAIGLRLLTQGPVGGDLLGHFALGDGRLALYSIDVSGHGIASALLAGRLAGLFAADDGGRNVAHRDPRGPPDPPETVMARVNAIMLGGLCEDIYFTAALAYLDRATGALELCQAGHPHPLLRRADGRVEALGDGGPPVGLFGGARFERTHARLHPGDALLLYTDGLTECTDAGGAMLGDEGLAALLARTGDAAPAAALDGIEAGLRAHASPVPFDDDVSMLLIRRDAG